MKKHTNKQNDFEMQAKQTKDSQKLGGNNSEPVYFNEAVDRAFEKLRSVGLKPNFLFLGNSVLHIATLNAFLLKLSSQGINPCGVVCDNIDPSRLSQFEKTDIFAASQNNFILLKRKVDFVFRDISAIHEVLNSCFPKFPIQATKSNDLEKPLDQTFFLLVTNEEYPSLELWEIASSQGLSVQCVLLEEGVGSYVSQKSTHEFFAKKETTAVKRGLGLLKEKIAYPIKCRYRASTRQMCNISYFGLLSNDNNVLSPNRDYCFWMQKSLETQAKIRGFDNKSFSDHVIIVGTNFGELGDKETERLFLEKIVDIINQSGFIPYFRPHPRIKDKTQYASLGVEVDANDQCPLEAVIASAQSLPVAIIGLGSSSQLLANVFWGIPSLTVASILKEAACEKISMTPTIAAYIERLQLFDKTFKEWFMPVAGTKELEEILKNL